MTEEKQTESNQAKGREELIEEFEKNNPELVEFLGTTQKNAAYVVLNGKVAVTGFNVDEFKKWKEEKAAQNEEPKQEEKEAKEASEKSLEIDDSGNGNSGDENSDEWEKRYYEQHKAIAESSKAKTSEPTYTKPGVSFDINGDNLSYSSPTKLSLGGKTNMEALRAVVVNAKKEGINGIDFSKIKDPKNIERFFALAVAYGMKIDGLEAIPAVSEEELAKMSKEERKLYSENSEKIQEKAKEKNKEKNKEPKQEEPKDYAFWREKISKAAEEHGENATFDFDSIKNEENKARAFLATKVLGVKTKNVDPEKLDVMAHVGELPKIDQMRLMVINKQETGVYKEKDSNFDKGRDERTETKVEHKEKIGKTAVGTDERKEAVAKRNAALEALKNKSR